MSTGCGRARATPSGNRSNDTDAIQSLQFVARAKRLGLSLEEVTEQLTLLEQDKCGPVQTRMRAIVAYQITRAQNQIADLIAFTSQPQGQHPDSMPTPQTVPATTRADAPSHPRRRVGPMAYSRELAEEIRTRVGTILESPRRRCSEALPSCWPGTWRSG